MRFLHIIYFISITTLIQSNSKRTASVAAFTYIRQSNHIRNTCTYKGIQRRGISFFKNVNYCDVSSKCNSFGRNKALTRSMSMSMSMMMMMSSRLPTNILLQKKNRTNTSSSSSLPNHHNINNEQQQGQTLQSNDKIMFQNMKQKRSGRVSLSSSSSSNGNISARSQRTSLQSTKISDESYFPFSSSSSLSSSISLPDIITKLIAFTIPISVLLTLAMNNTNDYPTSTVVSSASTAASKEIDFVLFEMEENIEKLESLGTNILNAAVPQDPTGLFSIALGESLAGLLGALSTWGLNMGIMGMMTMEDTTATGTTRTTTLENFNINNNNNNNQRMDGSSMKSKSGTKIVKNLVSSSSSLSSSSSSSSSPDKSLATTSKMDNIITEAVADGDYFLTRAAASPLIGSVGMSSGLTSALTVLLASVPYELIKLNARAKEQRREKEDLYMKTLLEEEEKRKKQWFGLGKTFMKNTNYNNLMTEKDKEEFIRKENQKMKDFINGEVEGPMEMKYQFDSIELFADICKWLEYDVLMTDFGGQLKWFSTGTPINTGLESAAFGLLAALSSQIYADIIYSYSDSMGTIAKRDEVRSRSIGEFFRLYSIKCVSAATLFGVYETARLPITQIVINFLSGGYESCLGSNDFDLCLETYFFSNPAEASPEAQFRSFVVALLNVFDRLAGDISNENVDTAGLIRSLSVQLYSMIGFDMSSLI